MANPRKQIITAGPTVTNAVTVYSTLVRGDIDYIQYIKDATAAYTDGVVFTITGETSGVNLWTETAVNASKTNYPTILLQDQVGVDTTLRGWIGLYNERVKIAITVAGDGETGTFHIATR